MISSAGEMARMRELLAAGGVAAVPTETFYGLATDPRSRAGVARIFEAKGRDDGKPLPVLFANRAQLEGLGVSVPGRLDRFFEIWPAPLTVLVPLSEPIAASGGRATLAVRMPARQDLLRLLESIGPTTGTSANLSGRPALSDAEAVERTFLTRIDLLVDGGETPGEKPSTLLDATVDPPVVIRRGAYPWPDV